MKNALEVIALGFYWIAAMFYDCTALLGKWMYEWAKAKLDRSKWKATWKGRI